MSRNNHHKKQSNNNNKHKPEPSARCAFTGKRDSISQMIRSDKIDPEGPVYFSSANALAMYKHLHGIAPIIGGTVEEAHNYYMDTLKKCYPKIYRSHFGDEQQNYKVADWNDDDWNCDDNE